MDIKYADLCQDDWTDEEKPLIDRSKKPKLEGHAKDFEKNGVLHLKKFIPEELIAHYCLLRDSVAEKGGWNMPTPYTHYRPIRDICLYTPLMNTMENLIGEPMMLHLNLTGYVSTERNWHSDSYLNPRHVSSYYLAVWIALDDISEHSGPFQYVAGSHKWPCISQEKVFEIMKKDGIEPSNPAWPRLTQGWLANACEQEIKSKKAEVTSYLPKKGDVLIWHSRLLHRGSEPTIKGTERKALIAHYSGIFHRDDMVLRSKHENPMWPSEGFYFEAGQPLEGPIRI